MVKERPKPTLPLILEAVGGTKEDLKGAWGLVSAMHHGLAEGGKPIARIYPYLNLREYLAFAANSWKKRDLREMRRILRTERTNTGLIRAVHEIGLPWIDKYSDLDQQINKWLKCNPYSSRTLEERAEAIPSETMEELRERLSRETYKWIFECSYAREKRAYGNHRLKIMKFQPVYPSKENRKNIECSAAEVARLMREHSPQCIERFLREERPQKFYR